MQIDWITWSIWLVGFIIMIIWIIIPLREFKKLVHQRRSEQKKK